MEDCVCGRHRFAVGRSCYRDTTQNMLTIDPVSPDQLVSGAYGRLGKYTLTELSSSGEYVSSAGGCFQSK